MPSTRPQRARLAGEEVLNLAPDPSELVSLVKKF